MKIVTVYLTIVLFAILPINNIIARNNVSKMPPRWLEYQDTNYNSNAYSIIIGEGDGDKLSAAKQNSFINMTTKLETERGIIVSSTMIATSEMTQTMNKKNYDIKEEFILKYEEKGKLINVKCKVIDEYWFMQNGRYICNTLYAVANGVYGSTIVDDIKVTASYGASGLWRSVIVPGWGQFYKGSKLKGGLMLGGTAALAIGAVVAEGQRADYTSKVSQTNNADHMRTYLNNANNMETARNICIGGAAAIYIYNLIDAIVAPGAKRVIIKSNSNFINNTVVTPIASSQMTGVGATYNF